MSTNLLYSKKGGYIQRRVPKYHLTLNIPFYLSVNREVLHVFYNEQENSYWEKYLKEGSYKFIVKKNRLEEVEFFMNDILEFKGNINVEDKGKMTELELLRKLRDHFKSLWISYQDVKRYDITLRNINFHSIIKFDDRISIKNTSNGEALNVMDKYFIPLNLELKHIYYWLDPIVKKKENLQTNFQQIKEAG